MDTTRNHQLPEEFYIATVRRPHGVRGSFRINLLSGEPDRLRYLEEFMLVNPEDEHDRFPMRLRAEESKVDSLILSAEPWTTPEEVKKYAGWCLAVSRHLGQVLDEDEYYMGDLVGLEVETVEGRKLGFIEEVLLDRSQPLFIILSLGEADLYIPALPEFVQAVNIADGRLVLDPPSGLVEIYREEDAQ